MITRVGIGSLLAGLFVGLFSGISQFMASENFWVGLTISRLIGETLSEKIVLFIDAVVVQNSLDFIVYEFPLFALFMVVGIVLLIISLFEKTH